MHKVKLLPKLALDGIRKNSSSYVPYMLITAFSVFVFFIFNAVYENPMMQNMPHAMYLLGLMLIGAFLLGIILLPVLVSTHQFLIKQRKNELGLYNVLGLDLKDIGMMMLFETIILYIVSVGLGILIAQVFSRLIFLVLLNMAHLDVQCEFVATKQSYLVTLIYFGIVFGINLIGSLWQVSRAKPIELMKSSKKGERQEKGLVFKTLLGLVILGLGYGIAIQSEVNSSIFSNFFFAVFLVVGGTRLLFKAGMIALLKKMKDIPKLYYQKHNFVTLSGMLYRMKRSANSLSNICIFSTMIMITLICTVSLFVDEDSAIYFNYPMDVRYDIEADTFTQKEAFKKQIETLSKAHQVQVHDEVSLQMQMLAVLKEDNAFVDNVERQWYLDNSYSLWLISLEDYNRMTNRPIHLEEQEVLIFSPTKDFGASKVYLNEEIYSVKEELKTFCLENKQPKNLATSNYYMVLSSPWQVEYWAKEMNATASDNRLYTVAFHLEGSQSQKDAFVKDLNTWMLKQQGGKAADYIGEREKDIRSMYGGLLFIGVFFGLIFTVCLLLMMYYKQITEGYEDQRNFKILKQVGMSDEEVRGTIKKQILLVFFLPLISAIIHTFVGVMLVEDLLGTIHLYNTELILACSIGVMLFFAVLYCVSYLLTNKAYYKIVK